MDRRRWKEPIDERIVAESVHLERRQALRIVRGAGLLVSVQTGTLWITEEGKADDIVVTPGRWYRIGGDALAIASAIEATRVTISAPLAAPARWEIQSVSPQGTPAGLRLRGARRGGRLARAVQAWWLRLYRSGAGAARRAAESRRHVEDALGLARLAAQLDSRTRRDIGLEGYAASYVERAERYRWLHDLHWSSRHSTFV